MIDFSLSDEQRLLRETARDFAENEIRPIVEQVHSHPGLEPWDLCRPMFCKAADLGFITMLIPKRYGGGGASCVDNVIVQEEIGAVDLGVAADYFNLTMTVPLMLLVGGNDEQKDRWLGELCSDGPFVLAGAQSEANVAGSELFCPFPDPSLGMRTFARHEGDEYVINGGKSAFISNAGVADRYFLMCRTDLNRPANQSMSLFYVRADTPGLSVGKRTEMVGMHTAYHAELFLDNVRIPEDLLIGQEGQAASIMFGAAAQMTVGLAAGLVGLARAAYEYALAYSKTRTSWGQPIIRHQGVALKLADLAIHVQAARMLVWEAAWATDRGDPLAAAVKCPAAKTFAADVAVKAGQTAVEVLGAYGVSKEYLASGYLADAWMGYSCDFTREILRMGMVESL